MSACLELELPAVEDGLPGVRDALTELCGLLGIDEEVVERARIATHEACLNCVRHAFEDADGATYMVETRESHGDLLVIVHDCGRGIDLPVIGQTEAYGLRLIEALADGTHVSSRAGYGTRVAMRFAPRRV